MSLTPREYFIMGLIAVMVSVLLAVTTSLYIKAGNSHDAVLQVVQDNAERLERLENNKARATARRWTADDQMDFIACMEYANFSVERRACINRIKARFQAAQQ